MDELADKFSRCLSVLGMLQPSQLLKRNFPVTASMGCCRLYWVWTPLLNTSGLFFPQSAFSGSRWLQLGSWRKLTQGGRNKDQIGREFLRSWKKKLVKMRCKLERRKENRNWEMGRDLETWRGWCGGYRSTATPGAFGDGENQNCLDNNLQKLRVQSFGNMHIVQEAPINFKSWAVE